MGYTIKQKIEICLQSEAHPHMTQSDLAVWAMQNYGSQKPPLQTTILRILRSKNDILGAKEADFLLVRRRKQTNPILRKILTEWISQALWERIPITTPIIQLTANAIWTRLPVEAKDGSGEFNHKWSNHFVKKLNINLGGSPAAIAANLGYKLDTVWNLDEKMDLKNHILSLIHTHNYAPADLFTIDEFQLFYALPLDQIFDISSIDKGLKQCSSSTENMLTVMLGCNVDGSEKLPPLVVSKNETFDLSGSSHSAFKTSGSMSSLALANKISEVFQISYNSNSNKWITSSLFQDYLLTLDHKLASASPNRNILIFLDDSSSHRMINLEFQHIRLCYMENASKHRNPYGGSYNGVKFDYLPMSFGIAEEFKILYRMQQYLEMINKQRRDTELPVSSSSSLAHLVLSETEVLAEADYQVPFVKVLEWIKRAWDSISSEKIFTSWRQTYLINFKNPWPASDGRVAQVARDFLQPLNEVSVNYNPQKSYEKLEEIMKYLNVVIPWDIDELLGLVNERSKVSLSYLSIEEIIGSCILGPQDDQHSQLQSDWLDTESLYIRKTVPLLESDYPLVPQSFSPDPQQFNSLASPVTLPSIRQPKILESYEYPSPSMNALLMATNVASTPGSSRANDFEERKHRLSVSSGSNGFFERKRSNFGIASTNPFFGNPATAVAAKPGSVDQMWPDFQNLGRSNSPTEYFNRLQYQSPINQEENTEPNGGNKDLISLLSKVIDASGSEELRLSSFALDELKSNLTKIKEKNNL